MCRNSVERGVYTTAVMLHELDWVFHSTSNDICQENAKAELTDDATIGTLQHCQDSGWIAGPLFLKWLAYFVHYSNVTIDKKVILIPNDCASHKNLKALKYAKE